MKPYVRGKNIFLREVAAEDAPYIHRLRTDPAKGRHISATNGDIENQRNYIAGYLKKSDEYYFMICGRDNAPLGTIRIYDIKDDSFCWGSWILSDDAPKTAALESALLIYDFAFFALHYSKSHFDVRKENERVVDFHKRFGAEIVGEDDLNFYFNYTREAYLAVRTRYGRYLP